MFRFSLAATQSILAVTLCFVIELSVADPLTVIFDNGRTKPLAEFLTPLAHIKRERASESSPNLGAANIEQLLPIRSPGLSPGKVPVRKHALPFARPFFLIGSDPWSRQWLAEHRQRLLNIGAVGLLVEATRIEDLKAIASIADGLPVTPAAGSDIAKALGVVHYPVAISDGRIWQ
ncbi:MAG: integrating conjugative element protein [Woeseia sp.]